MPKKIFFIGIGGKGLNGIAKICLEKKYQVCGVDKKKSPETVDLYKNGAQIFYEHKETNVKSDTDIVVYSSIINEECPEIIAAKKMGIRIIKRAEFLKELTVKDFRISISGSHGKSTTTALLGLSMINSGIDPTIFGGAYTKELSGYNHLGKSIYSVVEACEYDRSFFHLIGDATIITSIEKSHMEYYKDEDDMVGAFKEFVDLHPENSIIVANGDDIKIRQVTANSECHVVYFGFNESNDYVIKDLVKDKNSSTFSVYNSGQKIITDLKINIPGDYNILNFASCVAFCDVLDIPIFGIRETAKYFSGVGRRFEVHKAKTGQIFIDDFAHHPTQVKNLYKGIKQFYPDKKTYAVFEPRQYNLMNSFAKEYGSAFKGFDEVILTDIVPALGDTDNDIKSINSKDIAESIERYSQTKVHLIKTYSEISNYLKQKTRSGNVITTIGAGDIYKVREEFNKSV